MKKIFSILLASMVIGLFSSCILVVPEYTLYFYNDTENTIYDWYLKDDHGTNYTLSDDEYCVVPPNHYSYISEVKEGYYQVWFCTFSSGGRDAYFYSENFVHLNSDTTYYLKIDDFYTGSPYKSNKLLTDTIEEHKFTLVDSNGNEYKLVRD